MVAAPESTPFEEQPEAEHCDDCGAELDARGDCGQCQAFGDHVDLCIDEAKETDDA